MKLLEMQTFLVSDGLTDYSRIVNFYCDVLGIFKQDDGNFGQIRCEQFPTLVLQVLPPASGDSGKSVGNRTSGNPWIMFEIDDSREPEERLKTNNIASDVIDLPYGRQIVCSDPLGNRVCFFENPEARVQIDLDEALSD